MMRSKILLILLALACAGCPATLKPAAMTPQVDGEVHKSSSDVLVAVFGATNISAAKPVHITDEDFAQALATSIETSGVFRKALRDGVGPYQLQATFVNLDEQIFGLDMTSSMQVAYALARTSPKALVWEKTIASSHTAGMSDSIVSITRVQLATEGAARKNIEQAIQEISKLRLE
jgi:hypothetical protein